MSKTKKSKSKKTKYSKEYISSEDSDSDYPDVSKSKVTRYIIDSVNNDMGQDCEDLFKKPNEDLPWMEKYRPKTMDEIISHNEIMSLLKKFIKKKTLPHLLFFGPPGSGKTSTILCCANKIYGKYMHMMTMKLNASNERGIDVVRTKIKNFVSNKTTSLLPLEKQDLFKMIILDEIDSMTIEAQGMLRHTIEKYSRTTRFCLICNEIDKINLALQSRCSQFRFSPLSSENMLLKLEEICVKENIRKQKEALKTIIKITNGDMRSAINLLHLIKINMRDKKITTDYVYKISSTCNPKIIKKICKILVHGIDSEKERNIQKEVNKICTIMSDNNTNMGNLLDELKRFILESDFALKNQIYLINILAKNELYDSVNVEHNIIITCITSAFIIAADNPKK